MIVTTGARDRKAQHSTRNDINAIVYGFRKGFREFAAQTQIPQRRQITRVIAADAVRR